MCLTVLIPLQVYGATAYKRPWIYLVTAMVTYIIALMTLSRNTMLFATLITAVSLLLGCFVGRNKLLFRIFVPICVLGLASVVILSSDKLSVLLATVIEYGFSDNGRFKLWETGFDNFKESPILGKGFFGFGGDGLDATANFLPLMAHNTVIELLSALGVFGLLAYGYYRVSSLKPLFKKPRYSTVYVYLSIAAVLLMSLLDNYVFYIYTMFYYSVMLALAYRYAAADPESREKIAQNARESEE
jgi:O-antigen ligase